MTRQEAFGRVLEPARERPVLDEVDVAVAGAGISGSFAAIAAARCGAGTLVVERFGNLGGNIGPGLILAGSLWGEAEGTLPGGLSGISKEFADRLRARRVRSDQSRHHEDAGIASAVLHDMMKEAGVRFLLSAWASDPIVENGVVRGLFVECKAGRAAVRAKVTIDATGEADLAMRAGAPMVPYLAADRSLEGRIREKYLDARYPTYYNETLLLFLAAGVDMRRHEAFCAEDVALTPQEEEFQRSDRVFLPYAKAMIPAVKRAWESGEFKSRLAVAPGIEISVGQRFSDVGDGVASNRVGAVGAIDAADAGQLSMLESELRALAFRTVMFYRKSFPGFEKAYLVCISPFLGWRGGPHVEGEHVLTVDDCFDGRKFPDVLFRNIHEALHGGEPSGFDVPYRAVLPKGLDGLLVCGRGAAYARRGHDPTGMRARPSMMVFGQCVGTAAAIAALDGVTPRSVDIRKVQKRLLAGGIFLGEPERLEQLGVT